MVKNSTRSDGWASLFASHSMNHLQAPNSEAWISQKSMFSPPWGSVVLWGIPLMALHIRNSQRNICGARRKKRKNLSVLSTVWFGLCLASSINPLLTIAHLFFSFESPETEIPVCRARFWGEYIVFWVCSLMGRVRKRNAFFFFFFPGIFAEVQPLPKSCFRGLKMVGWKSYAGCLVRLTLCS